MNTLINLLWMYTSIAIATWVLGNVISLLLSRFMKPSPCARQERRRVWALGALPFAIPLIVISSLLVLSLAKYLGWIDDHCLHHQQHHPHFCFIHLPQILINASQSAIAFMSFGLACLIILYSFLKHAILQIKANTLQRLVNEKRLIKTVKNSEPFAFTLGIKKPVIYFSTGLKNTLSKRQQRIVAAHEAAHIRHGDVLKNSIFECLLSLHVFKSSLRDRWRFTMEATADDQVAKRFDSLEIAETLIRLQRATIKMSQPISIAGADINARINRLINPPASASAFILETLVATSLIAMPAFMISHHHSLETLLGWWLF